MLLLCDALVELADQSKYAPDSVDLVLTDIPYGEVNRESGGLRNFDKGAADVISFPLSALVAHLVRICKGSFYIFCGIEQVSELKRLFVDAGLSGIRLCIWEKTNASPINGTHHWLSSIECCMFAKKSGAFFSDIEALESCVWEEPTVHEQCHPTEKPLALFSRLIRASSKKGEVVLDPFMGSGTAGEAAVLSGRRFQGFEIKPEFFAIAKERITRAEEDMRIPCPHHLNLNVCSTCSPENVITSRRKKEQAETKAREEKALEEKNSEQNSFTW